MGAAGVSEVHTVVMFTVGLLGRLIICGAPKIDLPPESEAGAGFTASAGVGAGVSEAKATKADGWALADAVVPVRGADADSREEWRGDVAVVRMLLDKDALWTLCRLLGATNDVSPGTVLYDDGAPTVDSCVFIAFFGRLCMVCCCACVARWFGGHYRSYVGPAGGSYRGGEVHLPFAAKT
jgi:hypothetical protein